MADRQFFAEVINAGAILAGFCGTFLSFRLQREANYYRQPVLDYKDGKGKDVALGMTHFTSAFFLLALATLVAISTSVVLPLLALAGSTWALARGGIVVGGLIVTTILLVAYFADELLHYEVISGGRLVKDLSKWNWVLVVLSLLAAGFAGMAGYRAGPHNNELQRTRPAQAMEPRR